MLKLLTKPMKPAQIPVNIAWLTVREEPIDPFKNGVPYPLAEATISNFQWVFYHWVFWSGCPAYACTRNSRAFSALMDRMRGGGKR